jgi:hypothetical protein
MLSEFTSHFFLLPQTMPASISFSISGWSVVGAHEVGCCATYRSRARTRAELPTVQPKASEASWLSCWRRISASRVSVWVRATRKGFWGADFLAAIQRDHISPQKGMRDRKQNVRRYRKIYSLGSEFIRRH